MDFKRTFNSTTMYGRRNVAVATLASIGTFVLYKKLTGSSQVIYKYSYPLIQSNLNLYNQLLQFPLKLPYVYTCRWSIR